MNSLKPQGLFLANHFDDVDTLFGQRIHNGRQSISYISFSPTFLPTTISLLNISISYFANRKPRCLKQGLKASIEGNK
ncbi:hypothetical protein Hanom_Chr14g01301041 [Helianthus anomalus]